MGTKKLIDRAIDDFYTQASEENRLKQGLGPLELERNKDLIQRFLPLPPCVIVDVGGGPGIYSEWLAEMGHTVFLVDPVEKHIIQATKRAKKFKGKFQAILGEARKLELEDNCADVVILHGPLYHLQEKPDRLSSLKEAQRILKPDGIVLGFAINYTASTLVGLLNGFIHNEDFYQMCKSELSTGKHHPASSLPGLLPEAYFHKPEVLKSEFEEAGFSYLNTFAVESFIWLDSKYFESRGDAVKKQKIMELVKLTEKDKNLLALSPHMMIAAKKAAQ